jgi:hypothetical protein
MTPDESKAARAPSGGIGQTIIGDTGARKAATETLLDLADQADAEKAAIARRVEPVVEAARLLVEAEAPRTAAYLFHWIAAQYRARSFVACAEDFERQAHECRRRRKSK